VIDIMMAPAGSALEVFEARDGQEQILATPGPRDFVGDVAMLMESGRFRWSAGYDSFERRR
jgi:CRP-like cAMP-binding protein